MGSGRPSSGNGTRRMCREVVTMMKADRSIGVRIGDAVYSVGGADFGKYLRVVKQTERDGLKVKEISAMYISDFVDLVYNGGKSEDVKVVKL